MRPPRAFVCCPLFSVLFAATAFGQTAAQTTDFAHQVVPILQKHCVGCHGGREAKGSFSMNTRELLVESDHVTVGHPLESHLI